MNNSTIEIKAIIFNYLNISLRALIPIPFIVVALSFLKFEQDTILMVAFLCSVIVIEWLHFKKENKNAFLESKLVKTPSSISTYDLFFRPTDLRMYGAIVAKADSDDLMPSLELETKASKVYEWSEQ